MVFIIWLFILFIVSVVWAYYSLKKERQRHEMENAKKEMSTGRVIFHSSAAGENAEKS